MIDSLFAETEFHDAMKSDVLETITHFRLLMQWKTKEWTIITPWCPLPALIFSSFFMQTLEEKLEEILPLVLMHSKHDQPWVKVGSDRCN